MNNTMNNTTNSATNKTMKKNKINYFKEKRWIMAWWFKKNQGIDENKMFYQWKVWWKNDFSDIKDQKFQAAYEWVKETLKKSAAEIKQGRYNAAYNRPVSKALQRLAAEKGYIVKKCSTRNHPLKVSGYAVYKKGSKKPVYGEKFDLTGKEVYKFLDKQ